MAATTPATFDPKPRQLGTVIDCIAAAAILGGQVVASDGTNAWYVTPAIKGTTSIPYGVALYPQPTTGGHVAVAAVGSVLLVCEGAGSAITVGAQLQDSTAAGCVITAVAGAGLYFVGTALTAATANSTCYALINCGLKST
jgi:hypothetical protein